MTPEERDLITGLFSKLKAADSPEKDREAEDLIRRLVIELPSAPYLLAQTVLVQEQALAGAKARIDQLEQQVKAAQPPASSGTSFLGGAARSGPWGAFTSAPRPAPTPAFANPQQAAPVMPPPMMQPSYAAPMAGGSFGGMGGGGFLQSALSTAAGVAGGALLFEGIRGMMGHSNGPFSAAMGMPAGQPSEIVEHQVVNNYYGDSAAGAPQSGTVDAGYQPGSGGVEDADYQADNTDDLSTGLDSGGDDSA